MKRFQFKLRTVLRVKSRVEEERRRQLQSAETAWQAVWQQLQQCQEELTATMQEYQSRIHKQFDRYLAADYHHYVCWINCKIKTAIADLQQCETEVTRARQRLLAATRERKVLDKLEERAYQNYQRESLKNEITFLDELGAGRFVRRKVESAGEDH